ncbi:unnamed protein product [Rhizophagus irregularis]|nr:unnamed protein product [Rhizophagus irregularis]
MNQDSFRLRVGYIDFGFRFLGFGCTDFSFRLLGFEYMGFDFRFLGIGCNILGLWIDRVSTSNFWLGFSFGLLLNGFLFRTFVR